jgi:hypothetical protein
VHIRFPEVESFSQLEPSIQQKGSKTLQGLWSCRQIELLLLVVQDEVALLKKASIQQTLAWQDHSIPQTAFSHRETICLTGIISIYLQDFAKRS